ncbi:MAG TPA: NHL repeat-containing protein [Lachnospiraceae bacterium]|nr:NHL repeat-containing protein [Lachnospiraceae bacterium]
MNSIYKKKLTNISLFAILFIFLVVTMDRKACASESVPYDTYIYDVYEDIKYTPAAYIPEEVIRGKEWGIGALNSPQDINVTKDGTVYIADTGNNRIVVLDPKFHLIKVIEEFNNNGKKESFSSPSGIYFSLSGNLYIADTGNKRIVLLDEDSNLVNIIENPQSEVLDGEFVFVPLKVSVDYADRVYVIAKNMFQGIMAFDSEGNFTGFSGKIEVNISTSEKVWRIFTTKEQRSKQQLFIPTEFTGMEIDENGFIYATSIDAKGIQSVRRLNPKGEDVIRKGVGGISGDLDWRIRGDYSGASRIIDVVVRDKGLYSIIDSTRGRIFTYDHEGNLLYIFGGMGTQEGTFNTPTAIDTLDDKILVLDSGRNAIMSFTPSKYGSLINEAVGLRYDGDESKAVYCWEEVIKLDSNFELAYVGIGKSYLSSGNNKLAMKYFKLGKNQEYYSMAFKRYRNEVLKNNLQYILTGLIVIILGRKIYQFIRKRNKRRALDV